MMKQFRKRAVFKDMLSDLFCEGILYLWLFNKYDKISKLNQGL